MDIIKPYKMLEKGKNNLRVMSSQLKAKSEIQMALLVVYQALGRQQKLRTMPKREFSV